MTQIIQASDLTLYDVEDKFSLQKVDDEKFFPEWETDMPEVTEVEKQWLDLIKNDFISLGKYRFHEEIVKIAVLGPLLSLAGFFRYPFHPEAEVRVEDEDEEKVIRGRIDVLILREDFWVTVIEAKNKHFSLEQALPQALFYMMKNPHPEKQTFGLMTNGSHFTFIKLTHQDTPKYGLSEELSLYRRENELYRVLSILRRLGEL
ncbi:MAG: restriction endonuclease subunit R [Hormoscilla sp.]